MTQWIEGKERERELNRPFPVSGAVACLPLTPPWSMDLGQDDVRLDRHKKRGHHVVSPLRKRTASCVSDFLMVGHECKHNVTPRRLAVAKNCVL